MALRNVTLFAVASLLIVGAGHAQTSRSRVPEELRQKEFHIPRKMPPENPSQDTPYERAEKRRKLLEAFCADAPDPKPTGCEGAKRLVSPHPDEQSQTRTLAPPSEKPGAPEGLRLRR